jgi:Tfp pilus assembly protein PilW
MANKNEHGQSLIEVSAALALISMLVCGFMSVYTLSATGFDREYRQADIQYSVRRARQSIAEDFAQGNSFSILTSPGGEIIADGATGNYLRIVQTDQQVNYYAISGQLYRDTSTSPPVPVAQNITRVCFYSPGPNCLGIQAEASSGQQTLILKTQCSSRIGGQGFLK